MTVSGPQPIIQLETVWPLIEAEARKRCELGTANKTSHEISANEKLIDLLGAAGEAAWALLTNQPVQASMEQGGDDGMDFPDGTDIKATTHHPCHLLVPKTNNPLARRYILIRIDCENKVAFVEGQVGRKRVESEPLGRRCGTCGMTFRGEARIICHGDLQPVDAERELKGNTLNQLGAWRPSHSTG